MGFNSLNPIDLHPTGPSSQNLISRLPILPTGTTVEAIPCPAVLSFVSPTPELGVTEFNIPVADMRAIGADLFFGTKSKPYAPFDVLKSGVIVELPRIIQLSKRFLNIAGFMLQEYAVDSSLFFHLEQYNLGEYIARLPKFNRRERMEFQKFADASILEANPDLADFLIRCGFNNQKGAASAHNFRLHYNQYAQPSSDETGWHWKKDLTNRDYQIWN